MDLVLKDLGVRRDYTRLPSGYLVRKNSGDTGPRECSSRGGRGRGGCGGRGWRGRGATRMCREVGMKAMLTMAKDHGIPHLLTTTVTTQPAISPSNSGPSTERTMSIDEYMG